MDLQTQTDRRPARLSDQALTGTTRHWLQRMPWRQRPLALCERFPHVANRLAWCWNDAVVRERTFDELLADRRGGRRGFPTPVLRDLERLRTWGREAPVQPPVSTNGAQ